MARCFHSCHVLFLVLNMARCFHSCVCIVSSVEIAEDGKGDPGLAGHCDPSLASSWESRPSLLSPLLHLCCTRG